MNRPSTSRKQSVQYRKGSIIKSVRSRKKIFGEHGQKAGFAAGQQIANLEGGTLKGLDVGKGYSRYKALWGKSPTCGGIPNFGKESFRDRGRRVYRTESEKHEVGRCLEAGVYTGKAWGLSETVA